MASEAKSDNQDFEQIDNAISDPINTRQNNKMEPEPDDTQTTQPLESNKDQKNEETQDLNNETIEIQDKETQEVTDNLYNFVSGLIPFISALEGTEDLNNKESKDENDVSNDQTSPKQKRKNIEEHLMRPIRELIYKSFCEPSEGEEGIEYVMSELQKITNHSSPLCNSDLVVRSIGHFLSVSLPPSWIDSMCRWMLDRMQLILLKFLQFRHYCSCYFSGDIKKSRLFVLQCALHRRFPLLISEGCASLSRSPVFYGTKQCSLFNDNNYIECSWQLLQTGASFKIIPLHRSTHRTTHHRKTRKKDGSKVTDDKDDNDTIKDHLNLSPLTMDLKTLESEIERDQSKGRLPCVVIACHTDNLQRIRQICDRHGLWLHIEGGSSSLLLSAATQLPKTTRIMMQCADSISTQPYLWFTNDNSKRKRNKKSDIKKKKKVLQNRMKSENNKDNGLSIGMNLKKRYYEKNIPGCSSTLTFIREDLRDTPPPQSQYSDSDFVMMFPLWHLLVTRSIKDIKNRVDHSLNMCSYLRSQLNECRNIFTTSFLSTSLPQVVVFQIIPNTNVIDLSLFKLDINTFHELLINRCSEEIDELHFEWKLYDDCDEDDDGDDGVYSRYYYYGSDDDHASNKEYDTITPYFRFEPLCLSELIENGLISQFIQKIIVEINILRKCLELRREFEEIITTNTELQLVDVSVVQTIMIGIGAFRFVPTYFQNNLNSECVTILNKCLCDELNSNKNESDTQRYKLSMDCESAVCIVINPTEMVFKENCIEMIHSDIVNACANMTYPNQVMEELSDAIQAGIDSAQEIVETQAQSDYTPDSIIRKIPLFGSVYGWLLPTEEDNDNMQNTGVGFQFGVGMTKPNITINENEKKQNKSQEIEDEQQTNPPPQNDDEMINID